MSVTQIDIRILEIQSAGYRTKYGGVKFNYCNVKIYL